MSRIIAGKFKGKSEIEKELEISVFSDVCSRCVNFYRTKEVKRQCLAFPEGIPLEIWKGENNHTDTYPGDNGIRFNPIQIKRAA